MIQVILPNGVERSFPAVDIADQLSVDIASVPDAELVSTSIEWIDQNPSQFSNMKVTRPLSGNIVISEEFRYG